MMVMGARGTSACDGRLGVVLVALAPMLYVYMPRPPIGGAQFLTFPAIAGVLSIVVFWFVANRQSLDRPVVCLLLLFLAFNICAGIAFFANASEIRLTAVVELFRPLLFAVFLLFGYYVASGYGPSRVRDGLVLAAYLILIGQLIIAAAQVAGISIFGFLYSEEKTRPIGTILRATGSLGNPNIFAWVVAQATVIVYVFNRRRCIPWLVLGASLILVSGSRTMLLLYPFIIALVGIWSRYRGWTSYLRGMAFGVLILAALLTCVVVFSDFFLYLAQLRNLVHFGSLESINSVAKRIVRWQDTYDVFSRGGTLVWTFGLGSRELTRMMDNDFLFVFFRLGVLGFLAHACIFIYSVSILRQAGAQPVAIIGMQFLVFCLLLGFLFETLGGWNFPMLFFYFVGLSVGVSRFRGSPAPYRDQSLRGRAITPRPGSKLHGVTA